MADPKKPYHQIVAENIIEQLKSGVAPWQKPWDSGDFGFMPINPVTGRRYKGINTIHLMSQNRSDNRWMTYKQAQSLGAQVQKNPKGTPIQFWLFSEDRIKKDSNGDPIRDQDGKKVKETVKLERPKVLYSTVFNGEQIDGLPDREILSHKWDSIERAELILSNSGAIIKNDQYGKAFYRPSTDTIHLPPKEQFSAADKYYSVALHELGHWTGNETRLARDMIYPFGSEGYAKEELRAEISSLILGDELGIGHDPEQHASYIESWIKVLEDDHLEIFRAAADAEKISNFVLGLEQVQDLELNQNLGENMNNTNSLDLEILNDEKLQSKIKDFEKEDSLLSTPKKTTTQNYINVPFSEKDRAKDLGAKWDRKKKSWYVPSGLNLDKFSEWMPEDQAQTASTSQSPEEQAQTASTGQSPEEQAQTASTGQSPEEQAQTVMDERTYLAVPYEDKDIAKKAKARWDDSAKSWYADNNSNMAVLEKYLPSNIPEQQMPSMTPEEEFKSVLIDMGCEVSGDHPIMDGSKHRIRAVGDKSGVTDLNGSGFYIGYTDGLPAGYVMNNRTGEEIRWKSKGYALDPQQKAKIAAEAKQKLLERSKELEEKQNNKSIEITKQINTLNTPNSKTPYMENKGIEIHKGALTDKDNKITFIPAFDSAGKIWTMQKIQSDGTKRFAKDSKKEGAFHIVGGDFSDLENAPAICIQEGYATACTNTEALGFPTVSAFDSGNLKSVAISLKEKYPEKPFVIFADDDKALLMTHGKNVGKEKAEEAAKSIDADFYLPVFGKNENYYPDNLEPITPENYKQHIQAKKEIEGNPLNKEAFSLLLSDKQVEALSKMKAYTDFNDLAQKSYLGREEHKKQVTFAVSQTIKKAQSLNEKQNLSVNKANKLGGIK